MIAELIEEHRLAVVFGAEGVYVAKGVEHRLGKLLNEQITQYTFSEGSLHVTAPPWVYGETLEEAVLKAVE